MLSKPLRLSTGEALTGHSDEDLTACLKDRLRKALTIDPPEGSRAVISQKLVLSQNCESDGRPSLWYDRVEEACRTLTRENPQIVRLKFEDLGVCGDGRIVVLVQMMWRRP